MKVKLSQASAMVEIALRAKRVPMLWGSPAIGKSSIYHQIAEKFNLFIIDLRLSQCDPTDLLGFPRISGNKAGYAPMETFPIEGDELPKRADGTNYEGWLLLLDEITSASKEVQAASYKLILDRMVGQHNIHPRVMIAAAGNLETDNAVVEPMSTALQSRMIHIEVMVDYKDWLEWALSKSIDYRITSFINWKPEMLYTFRPDHTDKTYASPRTWEMVHDLLLQGDVYNLEMAALIDGTISDGPSREFQQFCRIHKELPSINDIINQPESTKVSSEPGTLFAITGAISHHATPENIEKLIVYINRLPIEFQAVCLRGVIKRNQKMMNTPVVQKWCSEKASILF